jgi:hypothetical protein
VGSTAALYFEGVQLGQNIAALVGSTAASFLEGVQFGPNIVAASYLEGVQFGPNTAALVGALLFHIWKGCSLDQTLWLY